MSISSTVKESLETKSVFPKLMVSTTSGLIVFFHTNDCGVTLTGNTFTKPGTYSEDWAMSSFKDFTGEITLFNSKE